MGLAMMTAILSYSFLYLLVPTEASEKSESAHTAYRHNISYRNQQLNV